MGNMGKYVGTPWGIILCIDYYKEEKIKGRIYHRYQKEPTEFHGMLEALLLIDKFFDELGSPFPGSKYHTFVKEERTKKSEMTKIWSDEEMLKNSGSKGTFVIRVEQRQHSTWQGKVTWVEAGKSESFRSALELIKMIDGALEAGNNTNSEE